ncbi:MAG: hypothetical protein KGD63_01490 [Candidatus Lokiarchaeota archaeon]|nr:hypothetical protein [Candidatus Lokiarchaeota archaeon]
MKKPVKRSVKISKGIIYTFFIIYLIIIGISLEGFINFYTNQHPGELPVFINYIPWVCYLGSIFSAIGLIIFARNVRVHKTRELKSQKKSHGSLYKQALFGIIFGFSLVPLLGPVIDKGVNDHNFSIHNSGWNGCSDFSDIIKGNGFDVMSLQSSLSATERMDKNILLVLMGPNSVYNPIFEIPFFIKFFQERNSLLLCHDHGSTSVLLWEIFAASAINLLNGSSIDDLVPVTLFPKGYLRDNASFLINPLFPVITSFSDHSTGITSGVSQVLLSKASAAAGGPLVDIFGWNVHGKSSDVYSFVDKNNDKKYNYSDDYLDLTILNGILNIPEQFLKFPLGYPFTPTVFMSKQTTNSRIFVSSDASLWNNDLINRPGYDNSQLALNVINWLTRQDQGDARSDWVVVFDEAHIRPEQSRDLSSAGIFGFIMQYIVHLSTNPITLWIYPLIAVYSLKKYLPKSGGKKARKKERKAEEEKEEVIKFRTSSFFAKKIEWYHNKAQYGKALTLLNRRLERKLNVQLGDRKLTTKNVVDLIQQKDSNITKNKVKRIARFIDNMIDLKIGKLKIRDEIQFENLFFEMEWVANNL